MQGRWRNLDRELNAWRDRLIGCLLDLETEQVQNLPVNRGNFTSLVAFTPGVVEGGASAGGTRLGGASQNNIMMDGISAMDTGNNGQMLSMNIESIGEVKVLTQGYQAEYGRSSGLQITAVTKGGTTTVQKSAGFSSKARRISV